MRLAVVAAVVALAVVVALVARPPERLVLATYQGLPGGVEADLGGARPGWVLGDDGKLAVYAAGSSSCPLLPREVSADGDVVTVVLDSDDDGPCTADLVYTTSVVAVPGGVDPARIDVELEVR